MQMAISQKTSPTKIDGRFSNITCYFDENECPKHPKKQTEIEKLTLKLQNLFRRKIQRSNRKEASSIESQFKIQLLCS